jgi:hypothetical protein
MTGKQRSRLVVERVDVLPSRPWVLVSGQLTGAPVAVGDDVIIRYGDRPDVHTAVRGIELHTRPGTTTLAIDAVLRDAVGPGAVVTAEAQQDLASLPP